MPHRAKIGQILIGIIGNSVSVPHFKMSQKKIFDDHQLTAGTISEIFSLMKKEIFPEGIPDDDFKKYLFAIVHSVRNRLKTVSSRNKKNRKTKYDKILLETHAVKLYELLDRETGGSIKLPYFITNCVPALFFPIDLRDAINKGKINLEEARTLNLINRKRLGKKVKREPYHIRRELMESHIKRKGTQKELRRRVYAKIGTTAKAEAESVTRVIAALDAETSALIELNELDTDHLLWEEIKNLVFLARDVDIHLIGDDELKSLLDDLGRLQSRLIKFKPKVSELVEQI